MNFNEENVMNFSLKPLRNFNINVSNIVFRKAGCRKINCKNERFGSLDMCALHCSEKNIDNSDTDKYIENFYKLFTKYLNKEIEVEIYRTRSQCQNEMEAREELEKIEQDIEEYHMFVGGIETYGLSANLKERLGNIDIVFKDYCFPDDTDMKYLDSEYHQILTYIGRVGFQRCHFDSSSLNLNSNTYYKSCKFRNDFIITPFPKFGIDEDYRYLSCIFKGNIHVSSLNNIKEISCNLFKECDFRGSITISNLNIKKSLFDLPKLLDNFEDKNFIENFNRFKKSYKIKNLTIMECSFDSSFKLNGFEDDYINKLKLNNIDFKVDDLVISSIRIINSKFDSKFEIKNRVIKDFKFENSNIEKVFDAFESKFEKSYFYKSIFSDFSGFERVVFGAEGKDTEEYQAKFVYTTFMSFSNFRSTIFLSGLDIESANLKERPNFLKTKISPKNTKRETFRIIKKSFDDVGNQMEANRFFVEEMKAYNKELDDGNKWDRLVYLANEEISDFGGSYTKPIKLLLLSIVIYTSWLSIHQSYFEEHIYFIHPWFDCLSKLANNSAKNFLPFSRFLVGKNGMEFISLVFYIWFGILIWQIIVAVKRHTQR